MADNVQASDQVGSSGPTFATDDIGGIHYPITKITFGALDSSNLVTSTSTNPFPVALSDTDNTVLDNIAASLAILDDWDDSDYANVNINLAGTDITAGAGAVAAGTPRVTLASDDPAVVDLAAIEVLLGTIDTDTSTLAAAVSTEMQCDIVGALPAGDNNIGNVDIASSVTITVDCNSSNVTIDNATIEVVGDAAEDAAVSGNPLLTGGRYDSTERTLDNGDVGAVALSPEGWMMVGNQSSYLFDGVTRCQIKRVSGLAASGTTAMVAAVSGKKIRILALALLATSTTVTNVYVATTTDTDVLGDSSNPIPLAVDADGDNSAGFVLPYNQGGWTETSTANEALNLVLSAAYDIIYALTYIEVD